MKKILFPVLASILIFSCNYSIEKMDNIIIEKKAILGQAFLGDSDFSEEYMPKENYMKIFRSNLKYWNYVRVLDKEGKEYIPKHFFIEDKRTTYLVPDRKLTFFVSRAIFSLRTSRQTRIKVA